MLLQIARGSSEEEIQQSDNEITTMNRVALVLFLFWLPLLAQNSKQDGIKDCPMHASHQTVVQSHGEQGMDFFHDKTTHHFRMLSDGGSSEVTANDSTTKRNTTPAFTPT